MMSWARKGLGLKEEIHGAAAVTPVGLQTQQIPFTLTTKDDEKWVTMDETNVETKTFYAMTDSGHIAMVQVVYSSLMGMRKTGTVNAKVFSKESGKSHVWNTDELKTWSFSDDKLNFKGEYSSLDLSEDGKTYHLKTQNKVVTVDVKFTQTAPGFKVGKDGTTLFGTDPAKPWGKMVHSFWPRCKVEGTIISKNGTTDLAGVGMYAYALQGMKPHFAACRWNFLSFQGPTYSAILMEFTTPPSYEHTVIAVGGVAKDGEIIFAGASPETKVEHTETKEDKSNKIQEPISATYTLGGKTQAGQAANGSVSGPLGTKIDLVDIFGELPAIVKSIASNASGTKPYIYQYGPQTTLNINVGGKEIQDAGRAFIEATYIS